MRENLKAGALSLCVLAAFGCRSEPNTDVKVGVSSRSTLSTNESQTGVDANTFGKLKFEKLTVGALSANCYLVFDTVTKKGILIDPGDEPDKIYRWVESLGVSVIGFYATHGHFDHVTAVPSLKERYGVPFYIHGEDKSQLIRIPNMAKMMGMPVSEPPIADKEIEDGDVIEVGRIKGRVIHTPGHSPGSVCFLFEGTLFTGDTLFSGSIGRTDLYKGSSRVLFQSIKNKLLSLNDDLAVFPGHGAATTIVKERINNPFLRRDHF